jgi:hypothetical protein
MSNRVTPIARIRLARSLPRLLAAPMVLVLAGGAALAAGLAFVGGAVALAVAAGGALLVILGVVAAVVLLSIRLEVEESAIGVTWLGGGRVYPLTAGPVTRVRLRGASASRLEARSRALGWSIGRARLRRQEPIEVVRLAPTATAILVPTERGRLAIAPAREDELLDALSRAARARQRLDALVEPEPAIEPPPSPVEPEPAPEVEPEPEPAPAPPRPLTGIERAMLELQQTEERAAAEAAEAAVAAEVERAAAAAVEHPTVETPASTLPAPVEAPSRGGRATARLRGRVSIPRPKPNVAFVFLPLIGAGAAWAAGLAVGRMPEPGTDLARLTSLALVLAGPATSIGAIMALAWWPRVVGVVVAGGLAASVFIGRALIGA